MHNKQTIEYVDSSLIQLRMTNARYHSCRANIPISKKSDISVKWDLF